MFSRLARSIHFLVYFSLGGATLVIAEGIVAWTLKIFKQHLNTSLLECIPMNKLQAVEVLDRYNLNGDARLALLEGIQQARDHVGTEHYLFGLLQDERVKRILAELTIDSSQRLMNTYTYLQVDDHKPVTTEEGYTDTALATLQHAQQVAKDKEITPVQVLLSILEQRFGGAVLLLLNTLPETEADKAAYQEVLRNAVRETDIALR